jgi:anti-sigma factor RsiW
MIPPREPSDDQIQAYVDGQLGGRDLATVAAYLLDHPELARKIQTLRRQNDALKQIGHEVLNEPIPERLRVVLGRPGRSSGTADCRARTSLFPAARSGSWSF